ncbi:hypothetical protein BEWA_006740 [Theileria equi strain WA]|uniref:GATA-type domain-containing protein n=1 Tax=Theileria equi strain WA TaxID=1537102 RepID=L0B0C0_THEEQ|nr:hypothetical protein BEWA_006740 [Theileria equi strain WA]AFZ81265.1 hypothetical protein BEWA_006740 [Theileria equi strain WA]|eukprot:XP_004830931.1 hypothetical protein BEWA_006740 [Theileria equi strain WA]
MNDFTKEAFGRHAKNSENKTMQDYIEYGNMNRGYSSNKPSPTLSSSSYFNQIPPTINLQSHFTSALIADGAIPEHAIDSFNDVNDADNGHSLYEREIQRRNLSPKHESLGKVSPSQYIMPQKQDEHTTTDNSLEDIREVGSYADCNGETEGYEVTNSPLQGEQNSQGIKYEMLNCGQGYQGDQVPDMTQGYYYNMFPYGHQQLYNDGDIYQNFNNAVDTNNEGIQHLNSSPPAFDGFLAGERYGSSSPIISGRGDSRSSPVHYSQLIQQNGAFHPNLHVSAGGMIPDLSMPTWLPTPTPTPETDTSARMSDSGSIHSYHGNSPLLFGHDPFILHANNMTNRSTNMRDNLIANRMNMHGKKRISQTPTVGRPRLNRNNYSCANCKVKTTPQWRYVNGIAVCNACYMRIRKDKSRIIQIGGKYIKKADK